MCLRELVYRLISSYLNPDWWMVALTLISIGASTALAFFAYRNGERAVEIAENASIREQAHREREEERREHAERYSAASAMARAFWALEAAILHEQAGDSEHAKLATRQANEFRVDAVVELELLNPREHPVELIEWFVSTCKRMEHLHDRPEERMPYRGEALGSVRRWKNRIDTVEKFLDPKRPL